MDTNLIKNQLRYSIPEELFSIEPGQIVFFYPSDGLIDQENLMTLNSFFACLRALEHNLRIKVSLVPTRNELLIDAIAGRNPQETGIPYNVVLGTWDSIPGIVAQYFGEDIEKVLAVYTRFGRRNDNTTLPAIIPIDPANRPVKEQNQSIESSIESSYQSGFDLGMKIAKPEKGSLAERKLIAKEEKKLEKILRECAVLGIELDIDRIKKKVEDDLKSTKNYQLSIKIQSDPHRLGRLSVCDIYVTDSEDGKLDLTSIEKAVYLSFLMYKDGVRVLDAFDELRWVTKRIYLRMPDYEKTKKENGIMNEEYATYDAYMNTLRGYFSTIRDAVADKVSDPLIAQEFSIEGFKNAPYGIERSTKEIRKQIKEAFKL